MVKVGKDLGSCKPGLKLLDFRWLNGLADQTEKFFTEKVNTQIDLEPSYDNLTAGRGKVGIVLFPGLLKHGGDDGKLGGLDESTSSASGDR